MGKQILASIVGRIERINKLICVKPLKSRYMPEVGDVVIGQVKQIANKR